MQNYILDSLLLQFYSLLIYRVSFSAYFHFKQGPTFKLSTHDCTGYIPLVHICLVLQMHTPTFICFLVRNNPSSPGSVCISHDVTPRLLLQVVSERDNSA